MILEDSTQKNGIKGQMSSRRNKLLDIPSDTLMRIVNFIVAKSTPSIKRLVYIKLLTMVAAERGNVEALHVIRMFDEIDDVVSKLRMYYTQSTLHLDLMNAFSNAKDIYDQARLFGQIVAYTKNIGNYKFHVISTNIIAAYIVGREIDDLQAHWSKEWRDSGELEYAHNVYVKVTVEARRAALLMFKLTNVPKDVRYLLGRKIYSMRIMHVLEWYKPKLDDIIITSDALKLKKLKK